MNTTLREPGLQVSSSTGSEDVDDIREMGFLSLPQQRPECRGPVGLGEINTEILCCGQEVNL